MSLTCHTGIAGDRVRVYDRPLFWFSLAVVMLLSLQVHAQSIPASRHVVLVIEENQEFTTVQSQMPWLNSMGNQYGYAANYQADTSGSLMDYLWLSSGSCEGGDCSPSAVPSGSGNFNCNGDNCGTLNPDGSVNPVPGIVTDDNIFRILDNAGLSWKLYAESIPSPGYTGDSAYPYVRRHNPAVWYSEINTDGSKVVDFTGNFANDLANGTLPNYSVVIPNMLDDAHDGTPAAADTWLQNNIGPILNTPPFQPGGDGILIITFDECDAAAGGNCASGLEHIYTAIIGPGVIRGTASNTFYKHENTLRTILQALGQTDFPLASGSAAPMCDFFNTCGGGGGGTTISNIDDQSWTCTGNCSTSVATTNQLDGRAVKFQYTGGAGFSQGKWTTPLSGNFTVSQASNFTLDFHSFITQPSLSQALEVHLLDQVGGYFYPFKIQCDFKSSGFWRVYNPSNDSWVSTPVGCVVFTANSWDHFTLHFHRSGTQLVYQDIVINGTTYSFGNITTNAIAQNNPDSLQAQTELIGNSSGSSYAWWIDEMSLTF